jgi:hypothetical protein
MEALGNLPEKKRALIQKYDIEGKSVSAVAEEMGLSKSVAQGRLNTPRGALLQCFKSSLEQNLRIPPAFFAKPAPDEICFRNFSEPPADV